MKIRVTSGRRFNVRNVVVRLVKLMDSSPSLYGGSVNITTIQNTIILVIDIAKQANDVQDMSHPDDIQQWKPKYKRRNEVPANVINAPIPGG